MAINLLRQLDSNQVQIADQILMGILAAYMRRMSRTFALLFSLSPMEMTPLEPMDKWLSASAAIVWAALVPVVVPHPSTPGPGKEGANALQIAPQSSAAIRCMSREGEPDHYAVNNSRLLDSLVYALLANMDNLSDTNSIVTRHSLTHIPKKSTASPIITILASHKKTTSFPMHRAIVNSFGPAKDVVQLEDYKPSPPGPGRVRVRMLLASINPSDLVTISGAYPSRTSLPHVHGFEGVGVIESLGEGW
ncbi:hypothetical protein CSAL01_00055 [Colletotrichum salicis]|uniref:Alcohol dehydrogenase-like N-terminal domain-containing protein n=1 Tax=Colletotrichum salicis TaxID=1209931 RepID=A0A135V8H7_9PEZI|nr:hypothetical protein CSAL01_00055 [Colletotrichum salicis]